MIYIKNDDELDCFKDQLSGEWIQACTQSGHNDDDISLLRREFNVIVCPIWGRKYVSGYGVESMGNACNEVLTDYVLWLACHDLAEREVN